MRRLTTPLVFAAAAFIAAGGYVHLREWLGGYRGIPSSVPGAAVVRIGFPLNAALSLVVAAALVATMFKARRIAPLTVAAALSFQASSLAAVILSRTGNLFGWSEPVWTRGASQSRAVAIGALVALAGVVALSEVQRRQRSLAPAVATVSA